MKLNYASLLIWINPFEKHEELLEIFKSECSDDFPNIDFLEKTDNLMEPIIIAINEQKKRDFSLSQINFQFNMDLDKIEDIPIFKEKVLKFFEILTDHQVEILYSSVFLNGEIILSDALEKITKMTINGNLHSEELVDVTLKLAKKEEDLFYKVISFLNKKQLYLPANMNNVPFPLISWYGAKEEKEFIEVNYEINDKYSYDFTKNYHTTEFHLNKMLYLLEQDFLNDTLQVIEQGKF